MLERDSEVNGVEVRGLALSRGGRALFAGLSLTLSPGEAMVVSGPNGAGKTSLLRAVAGLLRPDAGVIAFPGADAEAARERGLHFLGHHDGLKSARTAGEELAFWTRWLGGSAMDGAVAAFELGPLLRMEVRRLSAGQRRRVSLARLLAAPRPLWLLDEPLAPLDAARRARFGQILAQHLAEGGMVLAAAHDPLPILAQTLDLTPFPLDGGRAGDGGGGTTINVRAREATPFREPPPPPSTSRPAHTPNPDPSPIEGEGSEVA